MNYIEKIKEIQNSEKSNLQKLSDIMVAFAEHFKLEIDNEDHMMMFMENPENEHEIEMRLYTEHGYEINIKFNIHTTYGFEIGLFTVIYDMKLPQWMNTNPYCSILAITNDSRHVEIKDKIQFKIGFMAMTFESFKDQFDIAIGNLNIIKNQAY